MSTAHPNFYYHYYYSNRTYVSILIRKNQLGSDSSLLKNDLPSFCDYQPSWIWFLGSGK